MRKLILCTFVPFLLTSCAAAYLNGTGRNLYKFQHYEISAGQLSLIQFERLKNCPCKVFKSVDSVSPDSLFGVKIVLTKSYYYLNNDSIKVFGKSYAPGIQGSREKIYEAQILLLDTISNNTLDVTTHFYCDQSFLDNTNDHWRDYPHKYKDISCYYKDKKGNYRYYNTYKLRQTKPYYSQNASGTYFTKITNDSTYLCGWDLKSDADSFDKSRFFKNIEDFKVKFNTNKIIYNPGPSIRITLVANKKLPVDSYHQLVLYLTYDNGSRMELVKNLNSF